MSKRPPEDPWDTFQTVGATTRNRHRSLPLPIHLLLIIGATMVGTVLAIGVLFWYEMDQAGYTRRHRYEQHRRPVEHISREEARQRMATASAWGAAAGFVVGLGLSGAIVLRDRREAANRSYLE